MSQPFQWSLDATVSPRRREKDQQLHYLATGDGSQRAPSGLDS